LKPARDGELWRALRVGTVATATALLVAGFTRLVQLPSFALLVLTAVFALLIGVFAAAVATGVALRDLWDSGGDLVELIVERCLREPPDHYFAEWTIDEVDLYEDGASPAELDDVLQRRLLSERRWLLFERLTVTLFAFVFVLDATAVLASVITEDLTGKRLLRTVILIVLLVALRFSWTFHERRTARELAEETDMDIQAPFPRRLPQPPYRRRPR